MIHIIKCTRVKDEKQGADQILNNYKEHIEKRCKNKKVYLEHNCNTTTPDVILMFIWLTDNFPIVH